MKTLDEAMAFVSFLPEEYSPAKLAEMKDIHQRYESLFEEIKENERVRGMLRTSLGLFNQTGISPEDRLASILATTFMNGVIVGIEMTK